jgi:hypothetical protein
MSTSVFLLFHDREKRFVSNSLFVKIKDQLIFDMFCSLEDLKSIRNTVGRFQICKVITNESIKCHAPHNETTKVLVNIYEFQDFKALDNCSFKCLRCFSTAFFFELNSAISSSTSLSKTRSASCAVFANQLQSPRFFSTRILSWTICLAKRTTLRHAAYD